MARNGSVGDLGRSLADHDLRGDVRPCLLTCPGARNPQRPSGAQTGDEFSLERSAALDEEGLIDRLVADAHRLIVGEVHFQPRRDLLRAPPLYPSAIPMMGLVAALPLSDRRPILERAATGRGVAA